MSIHLRDTNHSMVEAWKKYFKDTPVDIKQESIMATPFDVVVSPANSFGFMDGGIDYLYTKAWPHVQGALQNRIKEMHFGILPVGQADYIATGHIAPKYIVAAPTMLGPARINGTINTFLAFRAALLCALTIVDEVNTIACPGMGTGAGGMDVNVAAKQMRIAYDQVSNLDTFPKNVQEAANLRRSLLTV